MLRQPDSPLRQQEIPHGESDNAISFLSAARRSQTKGKETARQKHRAQALSQVSRDPSSLTSFMFSGHGVRSPLWDSAFTFIHPFIPHVLLNT